MMSDREIWNAAPGGDVPPRSPRRFIVVGLVVAVLVIGAIAGTRYIGSTDEADPLPFVGDAPERPLTNQRAAVDAGQRLLEAAGGVGPDPLVDPSEIVSGGPPPDGIPPIDDPEFLSVSEIGWLADNEPVIAVVIDDDARAYPLQIMTWHEIVNDTVAGVPITVTFCPLCNTAFAFERPEVKGKVTSLGTSGLLYNSNLVMYDRATSSLWPQALGQAVIGPLTGKTLERVPAQIVSWDEYRTAFPDGAVLSRDTGFDRRYGQNPYPGYDDVDNPPFLFRGKKDGRLAAVERILGVETRSEITAFPYPELEANATDGAAAVNTSMGGRPIVVFWKQGTVSALDASNIASSKDVGAAGAFSARLGDGVLRFAVRSGAITDLQTKSTWNLFGRAVSGPLTGTRLKPLDAHDSFWFDWAAFHPETKIWSGS